MNTLKEDVECAEHSILGIKEWAAAEGIHLSIKQASNFLLSRPYGYSPALLSIALRNFRKRGLDINE